MLYPQPSIPHGVESSYKMIFFLGISMFSNPPYIGVESVVNFQIVFARNWMKCLDVYRRVMFPNALTGRWYESCMLSPVKEAA